MTIDNFTTRQLQKEAARVIASMDATSDNIWKFNKLGHHNSENWYKGAINWYIEKYGDLPSKIGPGKDITFIIED